MAGGGEPGPAFILSLAFPLADIPLHIPSSLPYSILSIFLHSFTLPNRPYTFVPSIPRFIHFPFINSFTHPFFHSSVFINPFLHSSLLLLFLHSWTNFFLKAFLPSFIPPSYIPFHLHSFLVVFPYLIYFSIPSFLLFFIFSYFSLPLSPVPLPSFKLSVIPSLSLFSCPHSSSFRLAS